MGSQIVKKTKKMNETKRSTQWLIHAEKNKKYSQLWHLCYTSTEIFMAMAFTLNNMWPFYYQDRPESWSQNKGMDPDPAKQYGFELMEKSTQKKSWCVKPNGLMNLINFISHIAIWLLKFFPWAKHRTIGHFRSKGEKSEFSLE